MARDANDWLEGVQAKLLTLVDSDGILDSASGLLGTLLGRSQNDLRNCRFQELVHPDDLPSFVEQLKIIAAGNGEVLSGWICRFQHNDGSYRWLMWTVTKAADRLYASVGDATEMKTREDDLRRSEGNLRLMIERVIDYAIFMLNPQGLVMSWNEGAERIKGYSDVEIIGRNFSEFYPPEDQATGKPARILDIARLQGSVEDQGWRVRKDGTRFWADAVITAIRNEEGVLQGYTKVTRDLTERKRIEALEESDKRMSEFIAMLGHELRNPLAPIRTATAVLDRASAGQEQRGSALRIIERQTLHLSRLVDDLLDVSRFARGTITLKKARHDLGEILRQGAQAAQPFIDEREQLLAIQLTSDPLDVLVDSTRISQVVVNLLNNASKFSPRDTVIELQLSVKDGNAVIRVSDQGMGITESELDHVFEMFSQGSHNVGGLGVGLSLVKRIAELHDGSVNLRSPGRDQGAEFIVTLPLYRDTASPTALERSAAESGNSAPHRILLIDDNLDALRTLAMLLELEGHLVQIAADGASGLAHFPRFRPSIVLLDIGLPDMTGYEVAREIQQLPGAKEATLIALTGYGQSEDRRKAHEAGFSAHLTKPVDVNRLTKLIGSLLPPAPLPHIGGTASGVQQNE